MEIEKKKQKIMNSRQPLYPHMSVYIDADLKDYGQALSYCTLSAPSRESSISALQSLWVTESNPNPCLPCLSVRTALDLYFTVRSFPAGSEVLMSAINIPSMVQIVHAHGLKVVALDIDLDTVSPRIDLVRRLITPRSRVMLLANIYGRGFDLDEYLDVAAEAGLEVVEDWAEGFSGLHYTGHSRSDLALFSFGPIKYYTAFGGCMAKIRDKTLYKAMSDLYATYPQQSVSTYLYKILKYLPVYGCLNVPWFMRMVVFACNSVGLDYKKTVVGLLRGFPADKLLPSLRCRPSTALLSMMVYRMRACDGSHVMEANKRANYILERLPKSVRTVGMKAKIKNHWLCPIVVADPVEALLSLSAVGVDAYRGATQLDVVESDNFIVTSPLLKLHPLLPVSNHKLTSSQRHSYHDSAIIKSADNDSALMKSADQQSASQERCTDALRMKILSNEVCLNHDISSEVRIDCECLSNCDYTNEYCDSKPTGSLCTSESIQQNIEIYDGDSLLSTSSYGSYPHTARYLIDHVVYLPINRLVPLDVLERMSRSINHALSDSSRHQSQPRSKLLMRSKL